MIHWSVSPHIRVPAEMAVRKPVFVHVDDINAKAIKGFRRQVDMAIETGQGIVPVIIDSFGGDVYAMNAMIDILDAARAHASVATIAVGKAMSAASVLLTCGDDGLRFVAPTATIMIHDAWGVAHGKTADIEAEAREMRRIDDDGYALMDRNCGKKRGYFSGLVAKRGRADWYLTPRECVRHRLANKIGVPEMVVQIAVEYAVCLPERPRKAAR